MAEKFHDADEPLRISAYRFADDDGKFVDANPIFTGDVASLSADDAKKCRDRCFKWLLAGWY
ncbi:hypothetical protein DPMN_049861 [Dreissena polymorpha]|uniref:Uncharacterized protein n=1 Tax=Dreissena polymorpha TaxID=45954 RepID=A0A9D4HLP8_DREPO|nr:hypothetical protein DPMN_049861 [Dreissena polymorpha]